MILTSNLFLQQERFDLEDINYLIASSQLDAQFFVRGIISPNPFILSGFTVATTVNSAPPLIVNMANSVLINSNSVNGFSYFVAPPTEAAASIPLTNNARNYIEISLSYVDGTLLPRNFWDPTANNGLGQEFIQTVDTVVNLQATIDVSTSSFTNDSNHLPIAIVDVNGSGAITLILDSRNLFFRLGQFTNEEYNYPWSSQQEPAIAVDLSGVSGTFKVGETVTFSGGATAQVQSINGSFIYVDLLSSINFTSGDTVVGNTSGASGTVVTAADSFSGADKDLKNLKDTLSAIQTEIKAIKGTPQWFNPAPTTLADIVSELAAPAYDERTLFPSGLAANTAITLPLNSREGNVQPTYDITAGKLEIYLNGIFKFQNSDWNAVNDTQISFNYALSNDSEVHFRVDAEGGGAGGGGGGGNESLQGAYNNGSIISVNAGEPVTINGPAGTKMLQLNGDLGVTGVIDPIGMELTPQSSNPLGSGKQGIWALSGVNTNQLIFEDGINPSFNIVQTIVNLQQGVGVTGLSLTLVNNTVSPIPAFSPVYLTAAGDIAIADGTTPASSIVVGVTTQAINPTYSGTVTYAGTVPNIPGLASGEYVYLGLSAGSLTTVQPSQGNGFPSGFTVIKLGIMSGTTLILQIQNMGVL